MSGTNKHALLESSYSTTNQRMMMGNTYFALRTRSVTTEEKKLIRNNKTKNKTNDECLPFNNKNGSVTKNLRYTGVAKELANKQNKEQSNENDTIKASNDVKTTAFTSNSNDTNISASSTFPTNIQVVAAMTQKL
jgi:hypothetical protein